MRRNYISPEYDYVKVYGTYNMTEQSSFFGSKMLKIDDSVSLDNQNLIYYQNINDEQIKLLDAIKMDWGQEYVSWDKMYEHAKAYYLKNGNLIVPHNYEVMIDGKTRYLSYRKSTNFLVQDGISSLY